MYYKNVGFEVYVPLTSQADTKLFKANPTLAAGDALLTVDGGATGNLATLPSVTPASGKQVKVSVSAAENSGSYGEVILSDVAGAEWCDLSFSWKNDDKVLSSGVAQAGAASTITLRSGASATNDLLKHAIIEIIAGTGQGQTRQITGYVGSTKVATVGAAWATNPDNTSVYLIHPAAGLIDALATAAAITALNNISTAQVLTQAASALTTYDPPTHAELVADGDVTQALIAALNNLSSAQAQTAAAAALTAYDPPTGAELVSEIDSVQAQMAALNNLSAAQVLTQAAAALTAYDPPTSAELVTEINAVQADIAALALGDLTAAEVWAYSPRTLTQSAAAVAAVLAGSNISVTRGTTWTIALTNIGALTLYDTVYFTVKEEEDQADTAALLKVYNNLSGLLVFNGDDPIIATNGKVVIDDVATGDITITVKEAETVGAPLGTGYHYDIKGIDNDGNVDLISSGGLFTVTADITRAIVSP